MGSSHRGPAGHPHTLIWVPGEPFAHDPLDVRHRGVRKSVQSLDLEDVAFSFQQSDPGETDRAGTPRAAGGEQSSQRYGRISLWMHLQVISLTAIEDEQDVQLSEQLYPVQTFGELREDLDLRYVPVDRDDLPDRGQQVSGIRNSWRRSLASSRFLWCSSRNSFILWVSSCLHSPHNISPLRHLSVRSSKALSSFSKR